MHSLRRRLRIGPDPQTGRGSPSLIAVAVVAVIAGLALGRFVGAGGSAPATADGTAAAAVGVSTPGSLAQRVGALEQRVAEAPDDLAALQQLGTAYVQRAAEVGDPSFYDLAARTFDRADARSPDEPATLLGRAALALALHDFAGARAMGEQLHELVPHSAGPLGVLVDAEVELGSYDVAAQRVQQMLDVDPGAAALSRASYLRQLHGDLEGAATAMRQAVNAAGSGTFEEAVVTALAGDIQWARGDVDAARAAYEQASTSAPGLPAAEVGLARALAAEGDLDDAITRLSQLVERIPHPDALVLLVELQTVAGQHDDAAATREVVRAVAALQEEAGQVVDLELGLFEADHGDPAAAVDLTRRAHAARPDNVHTQAALAWALARSGDAAGARSLMEAALRLGTRDALTRYHAAVILETLGEADRASEELASALEQNPWFTFGERDEARAMAERLGVEVPAGWSR